MRKLGLMLGMILAMASVSIAVRAEDAPNPAPGGNPGGGNNGGGRQRGGFGNMTPEQMKERMATYMKERLGVNDEEWKALAPKLEAVTKIQGDMRSGRFGGGGRGGPGGGPTTDEATKSDLVKKTEALRKLLEDKNAETSSIQLALKDLRAERAKAKDAITKAQNELKELLTAKQEAQLVLSGTLE